MSDLSRKQEKVMTDLLNGLTIADAAKANKVTESTIYNWLNDDAFKTEYRRLKREAFEVSIGKIQQKTDKAIETLEKNLTCGNPNAEIRAAQILLDHSSKAIETMDILERLENLEKLQSEANV